MPSSLDDLYNDAIAEVYAGDTSEDVILHTLELRHPSFFDADGNITAVRLVMDNGGVVVLPADGENPDTYGWYLTLEADAPINAGESMAFVNCMFDFTLPSQAEGSLPSIEISIDNVAELLSERMDAAVGTRAPIEVTYREYLASDPTTPQFILGGLSLQKVVSNLFRVKGTAVFTDLYNKAFPGKVYRPDEYPSLRP